MKPCHKCGKAAPDGYNLCLPCHRRRGLDAPSPRRSAVVCAKCQRRHLSTTAVKAGYTECSICRVRDRNRTGRLHAHKGGYKSDPEGHEGRIVALEAKMASAPEEPWDRIDNRAVGQVWIDLQGKEWTLIRFYPAGHTREGPVVTLERDGRRQQMEPRDLREWFARKETV